MPFIKRRSSYTDSREPRSGTSILEKLRSVLRKKSGECSDDAEVCLEWS